MIGNSLTLSSGCSFHYDVQLEGVTSPNGPTPLAGTGNGYLRVRTWNELKTAPGSGTAFARDNRPPFNTLF